MIVPVKISVLVIAYKRKEYIVSAVNSILSQTMHRDSYEIVVIKNFLDAEIDTFLRSQNVSLIFSERETLGAKCAEGIKLCKSDIIAFLEDDDEFEPNKLEIVYQSLYSENTVYYHNEPKIVNSKGVKINDKLFWNNNRRYILHTKDMKSICYSYSMWTGAFFNLSCIAIKKDILFKGIDKIDKMTVAVDNLMFYLALDSGKQLFIDNEILTRYRIHDSNDSILFKSLDSLLIDHKLSFLARDLNGYETILSLCGNTKIRQMIKCRILSPRIATALLKSDNKALNFHTLYNSFLCGLKYLNFQLLGLLLVYMFSYFSRDTGVYLFLLYNSAKGSKIT